MATPAVSAAEYEPITPSGWLEAGLGRHRAHDFAGAIAAFEAGLLLTDDAGDDALADEVTQLNFRLANAAMDLGDLDRAERHYKLALRIDLGLVSGWCNLGNVLQRKGRPSDSLSYYAQALQIDATHLPSRLNMAEAFIAMQQWLMARSVLEPLATERPEDALIQIMLGKVQVGHGDYPQAIRAFEAAVALAPANPDAIYWLASVRQTIGDDASARASYEAALRLKPLIHKPAAVFPAEFTVLALYAPFGGNTPTEYLFAETTYDINTYAVLAGQTHDIALL